MRISLIPLLLLVCHVFFPNPAKIKKYLLCKGSLLLFRCTWVTCRSFTLPEIFFPMLLVCSSDALIPDLYIFTLWWFIWLSIHIVWTTWLLFRLRSPAANMMQQVYNAPNKHNRAGNYMLSSSYKIPPQNYLSFTLPHRHIYTTARS